MSTKDTAITVLLEQAGAGDSGAAAQLHERLEDELRSIARHLMRDQRGGHTLQTTALVNEAWLRCSRADPDGEPCRGAFLRRAAVAMRSVLIDHARRHGAQKRGGGWKRAPLDDVAVFSDDPSQEVLALDAALRRFSAMDPQRAEVVELRFFGGLSIEEIADTIEISTATVKRHWRTARAWLRRELETMSDG